MRLPDGLTVLFIDTEGLGSTSRTQTEDSQIFSLALLLSSLFVWNSRGVIDGNALEDFALVVHLTKHIHVRSEAAKKALEAHARPGCQPRTFIQPCDWESDPTLLGQKIYALPVGIPIDDAFPYPCAAGVLGSADAQHQTSAACKEPCPAGYTCPSEATLQPVGCPAGYYCPAGSVRPVACPGGTSNGALRQTSVEACIDVPRGYWAPVGSATPEVCPASGFFCPGAADDALERMIDDPYVGETKREGGKGTD